MLISLLKLFSVVSFFLFILLFVEGIGLKLEILFHKLPLLNLPFYISFLLVSLFISIILFFFKIICCTNLNNYNR